MPRPKNAVPTVNLNLALPVDLRAKLNLHLYSELEGRVPQAAYQEFFSARLREFFARRELDLAPYVAEGVPGQQRVFGDAAAIEALERRLRA